MTAWQTLGVSQDIAPADLRRRYAALIKEFRPETHPQDFARIREAYEIVLQRARRREAEAAEVAGRTAPEAGPVAETSQAEPAAAREPAPEVRVATHVADVPEPPAEPPVTVVVAEVADALPLQSAVPGLPERFRSFIALAATSAKPRDEMQLLRELRGLLRARTHASLDDSQGLEFALMRWFLESGAPDCVLLFETGRAFDWHHHETRLSAWLPPASLRRMERLLALSRDAVYARYFSRNAWMRRLHAANGRLTTSARQAPLREAQRWAERWWRGCEDAGAPALAASLDVRTLARLQGGVLLSSDVVVGLMVASAAATELERMAVYAVAITALVFGLRRGAQAVQVLPEGRRARAALAAVTANVGIAVTASIVLAMLGIMTLGRAQGDLAGLLAGGLLVLPGSLFALWMLWQLAAYVECYLTEGFAWRDAVDRLEFDRFMRGRPVTDDTAPFGVRANAWQRWRSIRAALRFETAEIGARARPPLPPRFGRLSTLRGQRSVPRLMWFAAWLLFAILRVVHQLGTNH